MVMMPASKYVELVGGSSKVDLTVGIILRAAVGLLTDLERYFGP